MALPSHHTEFQELFVAHRQAVWAYCFRRLERADVEDAVAEVFVVVWRKREAVPDGDEALPWIYGVARNVVRNTNRSHVRRQLLGAKVASLGPDHGEGSDVPVVRHAEEEELLAAVARLPEDDREMVRLRVWEELPIADVASIVGRSPRSVESKLSRIRKKLSRQLAVPAGLIETASPRYAEEGGGK